MKKVILLLWATSLILPLSAYAYTQIVNEIEWIYEVSNNMATIVGEQPNTGLYDLSRKGCLRGVQGEVSVPAYLGGFQVIAIGDYAFAECVGITKIYVPEGVLAIGAYTFQSCSALTSISIPNSVTNIGYRAFYGCSALCVLDIPDSVKSIGERAFQDCSNICKISLPDGLLVIGEGMFMGCSSLTNISIPDSVIRVGRWAFSGCKKLDMTSHIPGTTMVDGWIIGGTASGEIVFNKVKGIADCAFSSCKNLRRATITASVKGIGDEAFYYCDNLVSVIIEDGLQTIGSGAFSYCKSLGSVVIPDSVNEIGRSAFGNCSQLFSVSLGQGLKTISASMFGSCTILGSVYIPSNISMIDEYAFSGCSGLTSVMLSDGLKTICKYAFRDCVALTSLKIPNSVSSIDAQAFDGCSKLYDDKTIPNARMVDGWVIDGNASENCLNLTGARGIAESALIYLGERGEVFIPSDMKCISRASFYGNGTIVVDTGNPFYQSNGGSLLTKNGKELVCGMGNDCVIPYGVEIIGDRAFDSCSSKLKSVVIPETVEQIGNYAFRGCSSLSSVTIPDSVTSIGDGAFLGCSGLMSVTIPNSVASIGNSAFSCCRGLTSVTIPDSVTSIGNSAFEGCKGLKSVLIPNSVTSIGECAFADCSGLTSVTIPDSVTSIGNSAFYNCSGLTSVTIPDSVTSIEGHAFDGCASLKSISLPEGLARIGQGVFKYCHAIEQMEIPISVYWIGWYVFDYSGIKSLSLNKSFAELIRLSYSSLGLSSSCKIIPTVSMSIDSELNSSTTSYRYTVGDIVSCDVGSPVLNDQNASIRFVCTGWSGIGSVPSCGMVTNVVFIIEEDSSITWHWQKECFLNISASGKSLGSIAPWMKTNIPWSAPASADSGFKSGAISAGDISYVETTIVGPGTLSFKWRISAGRGDFCKFYLDGVEQASITRSTDWATVTLDIPAGQHTFRWSYERGSGAASGDDAAFLDDVDWRPELSFSVASAYGETTPAKGAHTLVYGDEVSASVVEPAAANGTRRVCTGWTGTGSVPTNGTEKSVAFAIKEDSSLTWNWRTDHLIGVSVSGGTCDFTSQWVADGTQVAVEIIPETHLYTISLFGDTQGATLDGTTLIFAADRPRNVAVTVNEVKVSLTVESEWGIPTPTNGVHALSWGTEVTASVQGPEPTRGYQYLCTGWKGSGSVPASGAETNVSFTIERDSSIRWNWQTNVWLSLAASGPVSAGFAKDWIEIGETVVANWTPTVPYFAVSLAGDTDGVALDEAARTLTIPADRPRDITLTVGEFGVADVVGSPVLRWVTGGAAEWEPQLDVSRDGNGAAMSGLVGANEASILQTSLSGSGVFSWSWKIDSVAGGNVGVDVLLDGEWLDRFAPTADWTSESLEIAGDGEHMLRFEFWNAGKGREDCAYLDEVQWTGEPGPCASAEDIAMALENGMLVFTTGGDAPWFGQSAHSGIGSDAMQSGEIGVGESSWLETTVEGPGIISFLWNAASQADGTNCLETFVDGVRQNAIGGVPTNWTAMAVSIEEGSHAIRWSVSGTSCSERGWLDSVEWTQQYVITLDKQFGTGGDEQVIAMTNSVMPTIAVPTRTGYTFGGYWTATDGGGTQYYTASGASARNWDKTSAATLYAKWTANTYAVTLNRQSGTGGSASATATYGSAMPAITVPTRTGYTFGGYFTSANGGGTQYYTASGASARNWDKTSATTLYAKWTGNTYTVTLNRQSGSGGSASVTARYGSAMPSITVPTRTGYTFGGYFTAANGGGTQYYTSFGTSAHNWNRTAAITLYAKWTANAYVLTLDSQGGSGGATSVTAIYDSSMPAISVPSRTDYTFFGFFSEPDGGGTQYYTASGFSVRNWDRTSVTTLYARWIETTGQIAGSDLFWSVSGTTLTISGHGPMPDYADAEPSYQLHADGVTEIVVEEGVTYIGEYAFSMFPNATAVSLPASLEAVGLYAFGNCVNIEHVTIASVESWCEVDFGGVSSNPMELRPEGCHLYLNGSLVLDLVIPNGVTQISDYAFCNCRDISSVTIPASVADIGECAFYGDSNLSTVRVSEGLEYVGPLAFSGTRIESFKFPDSLLYIGKSAFQGTPLGAVSIKSGYIGECAFADCGSMWLAYLGKDVVVDENAFQNCPGIRNTVRGSTVTVPATFTMGSYDGAVIEWQVLDLQDGVAFVVSTRVLGCALFNETPDRNAGGWAQSDIRAWLNGEFFNGAFTAQEKGAILHAAISTEANAQYGTPGGEDTEDDVFLLSAEELEECLPTPERRAAKPLAGDSDPDAPLGAAGYYWLRTPGAVVDFAMYVDEFGHLRHLGANKAGSEAFGVRPAMMVDAEALGISSATTTKTTSPGHANAAGADVYDFVARLYSLCLDRAPDQNGLNTWAQRLSSSTHNGAMAAFGFFFSAEMERRNLSNGEFVEILYNALMGRAPDSNGKAYWVNLLDNGISRRGVFRGFAESAEFTRICGDYGIVRGSVDPSKLEERDKNRGVTMFVARCYTKALNRNYDVKGLNSWCAKINSSSTKKATAIQVAKSFLNSKEFKNRNLSNSAYVDVLYQTFFDRNPDTNGKNKWLGQLNSGVSRDKVMASFYNSAEFSRIMAGYGIR